MEKKFSKIFVRTPAILMAIVLILSLALMPLIPLAKAADVSWTKSSNDVLLETATDNDGDNDQLFVTDSFVIKNTSSSYEMWYTHFKLAPGFSLTSFLSDLNTVLTADIRNDLTNLNLDNLLTHLAALDSNAVDALYRVLTAGRMVIGYATSTDGEDWTIVNDEVIAVGSAGGWGHAGIPSVIKTASDDYEMWYTRNVNTPTKTDLTNILDGLDGGDAARKNSILQLKSYTDTTIGYATWTGSGAWTNVSSGVAGLGATGGGAGWFVGAPSVVKNDTNDYEMWYTVGRTDVDSAGLDTLLGSASMTSFQNDIGIWLEDILDGTNTVINHAVATTDRASWTGDATVLSGSSTSLEDSVGLPSVVKNGTDYDMWYTRGRSDLTVANLKTLIQTDILGIDLTAYWDAARVDPVVFMTDGGGLDIFDLVTALGNAKTKLANTSTVISAGKFNASMVWTPEASLDLVGAEDGLWASVGRPSVVEDNGSYELWYSEGLWKTIDPVAGAIEIFSAENIYDLLRGNTLPIGYATSAPSITANTSLSQGLDATSIVVINVNINSTSTDITGGITSCAGQLTFDSAGIEVLDMQASAVGGTVNYNSGDKTFTVTGATAFQPNTEGITSAAQIVARLIGNVTTSYTLDATLSTINGSAITQGTHPTLTFLRGDTLGDGEVLLSDSTAIKQYLVGERTLSQINPLNAASIIAATGGDTILLTDSTAIKQFLVGERNSSFE